MENNSQNNSFKTPKKNRKWLKITLALVAVLAVAGTGFAIKTGMILNKMSAGEGGILKSILKSVPGVANELKGEKDGRINVLLLGMRGENVLGGGLLADTIMVASVKIGATPEENKVSMISIPRDFFVPVPDKDFSAKINAVHFYGEEKGKGQGIQDMKKVISDITGIPIHYGVSINFKGFTDLVDAIGGIDVNLDQPFEERMQFRGLEKRCDGIRFTIPSGNKEIKRIQRKNGTYYANPKVYPLCFEKISQNTENELECGGDFKLPAGINHLDGTTALCFARARYTSNDFERAKRQQLVIKLIKEKALSIGTLTDFNKINGILNSLGDNTRTDMEAWEMKSFFDLYQKMGNDTPILQHVLENSEEGLLYAPEAKPETGYILLPRGDNYDRLRNLFQNVFDLPSQSDIKM